MGFFRLRFLAGMLADKKDTGRAFELMLVGWFVSSAWEIAFIS
jgi:hypothetical protein